MQKGAGEIWGTGVNLSKGNVETGVVFHACNPSTQKLRQEDLCELRSQPGLLHSELQSGIHSETLFQKERGEGGKERET